MMKSMVLMVTAVALLTAGCEPAPRGAVRPAPPGPFDVIRSIWGDYSARCPEAYDYCGTAVRGICCPYRRGCCEGADGPYCCASSTDGDWDDRDDYPSRSYDRCESSELTCSHEGRTVCCDGDQACCADRDGPYCCESRRYHDRDKSAY